MHQQSLEGRLGAFAQSALGPAVAVGAFYALLLVLLLGPAHHDPRDFIEIGYGFLDRSHASAVIQVDPAYHRRLQKTGYDGQFYYYIALDPGHARPYIDEPTYRYGRILYPVLARVLALGRAGLIPYALIAINWLAVTGGTLALAARLRSAGMSGWPALVFGLAPGMYTSLRRDLADALAYALVALAVYLFYRGGRARIASAAVLAGAVLTRETTAVFALAFALAVVFHLPPPHHPLKSPSPLGGGLGRGVVFLAIALGPALLYRAALAVWVGGRAVGDPFEPLPFLGLADHWPFNRLLLAEIVTIVLPCLLAGGAAVLALSRRQASPETIALLGNVVLFVVFLNHYAYVDFAASSRIILGVVLATVLALPRLPSPVTGKGGGAPAWFVVTAALWLLPFPFVLLPLLGRAVGIG